MLFFQFLVEDQSGGKLISAVMERYREERTEITIEYDIRAYRGIGGFARGENAKNIKSDKLLIDLPKRLKAFNIALQGRSASLFIVLDNDTRDVDRFRQHLQAVSVENHITIDHVYCIAVEEMEAWLLGDIEAIQKAYPELFDRIATKHATYQQDSIGKTWEFLFEMLTKKNTSKIRMEKLSFVDIGKYKLEWADKIGAYLNIRNNKSPSFQYFLGELDRHSA